MSAIFDPSLPTQKDHIRLALGDKHSLSTSSDVTEPLLQDETIQAKIDSFGYSEALAQLADGLASEYAQVPDRFAETGGVSFSWSERVKNWRELAKLARSGNMVPPGVTATSKKIYRPGPASGTLTNPRSAHNMPNRDHFRSD